MEVILREDVEHLGKAGDIVKVAPGYARNYLIPKKYAMPKTKGYLKMWEMEKKSREIKRRKLIAKAEELRSELEKIQLTISMAAGEEDQLYGSVTEQIIAEELQQQNFDIDKNQVLLDSHIKKLGVYEVPIKLEHDVIANIKVWVVKKD